MALSIDGKATEATISGGVSTVTLTTSLTNDIIVVAAVSGGAINHITGITDTAGLTWAKRSAKAFNTIQDEEIWWALSTGALTSDAISVTFTGGPSSARVTAFGVNGANTTTPWDTNASLPAITNVTSANSIGLMISTTNANCMLIGFLYGTGVGTGIVRPTGFTALEAFSGNDLSTSIVSAAQPSVTETWSWTTATAAALIVDAIQEASSSSGHIFLPSRLNGISTGGYFFSNPIG